MSTRVKKDRRIEQARFAPSRIHHDDIEVIPELNRGDNAERMIFLCFFKSIPWQIIESLQICYDNGNDTVKDAVLNAAQNIDRHIRLLARIYTTVKEDNHAT